MGIAAVIALIVAVAALPRGSGVRLDPDRVLVAVFENETGDPALDAMRHRLGESLCVHEAQALRDDDALREQAARTAEDILADMAGYVTPAAAE